MHALPTPCETEAEVRATPWSDLATSWRQAETVNSEGVDRIGGLYLDVLTTPQFESGQLLTQPDMGYWHEKCTNIRRIPTCSSHSILNFKT